MRLAPLKTQPFLGNDTFTFFFDADGTLWPDRGPGSILDSIDYDEIARNLKKFEAIQKHSRFVIISNQTCVARGLCDLDTLENRIAEILRQLNLRGIQVSFFFCPHHPNANVDRFREICNCRKPRSELFKMAIARLGVDVNRALMIGDRITDMYAAFDVGIKQNFLIFDERSFEWNLGIIPREYERRSVPFIPMNSFSDIYSLIQ